MAAKAVRAYLAVTVHHLAGDNASREILMTDIFTAFGQRLAGQTIALQPVGTTGGNGRTRCVALATHPAVLESREFWLGGAAKDDIAAAATRRRRAAVRRRSGQAVRRC